MDMLCVYTALRLAGNTGQERSEASFGPSKEAQEDQGLRTGLSLFPETHGHRALGCQGSQSEGKSRLQKRLFR